jgi:SAM-dependent methyltransferase
MMVPDRRFLFKFVTVIALATLPFWSAANFAAKPSAFCESYLSQSFRPSNSLELRTDTLYQDLLTEPLAPKDWMQELGTHTPLTRERLSALFKETELNPSSIREFLGPAGGFHDGFAQVVDKYIKAPYSLNRAMLSAKDEMPEYFAAYLDFLDVMGRNSPAMARYLFELGYSRDVEKIVPDKSEHIFPKFETDGEYWDLSSGLLILSHLSWELNPKTHYKFFDISPFAVGVLNAFIERNHLNAEAIQADARALPKSSKKPAVIRVKNTWGYVRDFPDYIPDLAEALSPGGYLVFQDRRFHPEVIRLLNATWRGAVSLLEKGWTLTYDLNLAHTDGMLFINLKKPQGRGTKMSKDQAFAQWMQMINSSFTGKAQIVFTGDEFKFMRMQ